MILRTCNGHTKVPTSKTFAEFIINNPKRNVLKVDVIISVFVSKVTTDTIEGLSSIIEMLRVYLHCNCVIKNRITLRHKQTPVLVGCCSNQKLS